MSIGSLISEINSRILLSGASILGVITCQIGACAQKSKVLSCFSITTQLKICILDMVALIARRSKYDFWIPDEILTLEIKIQIKKIFFRDRKFWSNKKSEIFSDQKNFPIQKSKKKNDFSKKSIFSIFGWEFFLVQKNFGFFLSIWKIYLLSRNGIGSTGEYPQILHLEAASFFSFCYKSMLT